MASLTGANTGIGFETAKALASKGYATVLACRNLEKGRAARDQIKYTPLCPLMKVPCLCSTAALLKHPAVGMPDQTSCLHAGQRCQVQRLRQSLWI